jgi:hypothetical protein
VIPVELSLRNTEVISGRTSAKRAGKMSVAFVFFARA